MIVKRKKKLEEKIAVENRYCTIILSNIINVQKREEGKKSLPD